jgi:hypothetical protein
MVAFAAACSGVMTVGTSMSGTDLYIGVMKILLHILDRKISHGLRMKHVFSCEEVDFKRDLCDLMLLAGTPSSNVSHRWHPRFAQLAQKPQFIIS